MRRGQLFDKLVQMRLLFTTAAVMGLCLSCVSCAESDLRGSFRASKDGKTYLAVVDENGGHCGAIRVDGKVWTHPIGEAGQIDPGRHTIECGGEIGFDIHPGVIYKFSYWGP
jgi:hypothetical protein